MIVCVCNGVNDRQVKAAIRNGATNMEALSATTGVASGCGCCRETCAELLSEAGCASSCVSMFQSALHMEQRPVFNLMPVAA
ncbi:MAG TPA: (2Fe-2S)-binding protein [Rhodocyclaceae bacterium]|jgi:bacterioferritin-associated ferredoxin|nr:(2Fe-2S)-binding protein [Rhodocyclaceae bacterium]